MLINRQWLEEHNACEEGEEWFLQQGITNPVKGIRNLVKHGKLGWANWLMVRVLDCKQRIMYAVFAAEQVIELFEAKHPKDKRPRKAVEAAKAVLKQNTAENRAAARAAAEAAVEAARAAEAAAVESWAAWAAARAADATWAAAGAAWAAWAAEAADATWAAAGAAWAAWAAEAAVEATWAAAGAVTKTKIIEYGISLLRVEGTNEHDA